jgi:hypothetical protein
MIWSTALKVMMQQPWSFLTGFGFDVYSTMGFEYAPHNAYLGMLFNLGLPGLVAFLLIIVQAAFAARSAAEIAPPEVSWLPDRLRDRVPRAVRHDLLRRAARALALRLGVHRADDAPGGLRAGRACRRPARRGHGDIRATPGARATAGGIEPLSCQRRARGRAGVVQRGALPRPMARAARSRIA